jgi:NTE family protein
VLSGGGARAAYQVGVLRAVARILGDRNRNPFPIVCGTSAGAINAMLLACESDRFTEGVALLEELWRALDSDHVHEIGLGAVASSLARLVASMFNDGYTGEHPWSLLDNSPLRELLSRAIRFDRIGQRIAQGDLSALSVTALGYTSGASLSFYQGGGNIPAWKRHRRIGLPAKLGISHLMASAAIPGIYPPVKIQSEYFGDGAVRQSAPLSTALHLGASRLFVIGVSHNPDELEVPMAAALHAPSLAQMTSTFLNGSFIDALEEDVERLGRINEMLGYLSEEEKKHVALSHVDVMTITPSKRFDQIAAAHLHTLPRSMRFLFHTLGATRTGGGTSLASYLLFEKPFIAELIECGFNDAMSRQSELRAFLT